MENSKMVSIDQIVSSKNNPRKTLDAAKAQAKERSDNKAEQRCRILMDTSWRKFTAEKFVFSTFAINVLICKQIYDAINGFVGSPKHRPDEIDWLWNKKPAEITKLIQDGLAELIKSQFNVNELQAVAKGLKYDPVKNMVLDDTYWQACGKQDLLDLADQLGIKGLSETEKRGDLEVKVRAKVKPGFVPADVKKFIAKKV